MPIYSLAGTVRIWHANTYRLESTLNYGMDRVWAMASMKGSNNVAIGYDEGSIMVKVGLFALCIVYFKHNTELMPFL